MNLEPILELAEQWSSQAQTLRRRGASGPAEALDSVAEDLTSRLREWQAEALTLDEAADESGYSREHLGHLVRQGKLPNAGETGTPRIRREDLPRKPGEGAAPTTGIESPNETPVASRSQMARSVVESE